MKNSRRSLTQSHQHDGHTSLPEITAGSHEAALSTLDNSARPAATLPSPLSLENLPVEIHIAILQHVTDISTLRSLVLSSSTIYKSYIGQRRDILAAVLRNDMSPEIYLEARSVYKASTIPGPTQGEEWMSHVRLFLEAYGREQKSSVGPPCDTPHLNELVSMTKRHILVGAIGSEYTASTLPKTPGAKQVEGPLSPNEKRRIHRALYRYELFCILFASSMTFERPYFEYDDIATLFLEALKEWEVEEIACISEYLFNRWVEIFGQCGDNWMQLHTKRSSMKGKNMGLLTRGVSSGFASMNRIRTTI
jgi:hypothetical protein